MSTKTFSLQHFKLFNLSSASPKKIWSRIHSKRCIQLSCPSSVMKSRPQSGFPHFLLYTYCWAATYNHIDSEKVESEIRRSVRMFSVYILNFSIKVWVICQVQDSRRPEWILFYLLLLFFSINILTNASSRLWCSCIFTNQQLFRRWWKQTL